MADKSGAREMAAVLRSGAGPLARRVLANGGSVRIAELAEFFERHRSDKALGEAIERVCGEGYYKLKGETSARRLVRLRPLRLARICLECNEREFGNLAWKCVRHPRKTVDQENRPYDDPRVDWSKPPMLMSYGSGYVGFRSIEDRVTAFGQMAGAKPPAEAATTS
jgi:hypothetical protein